MINKLSKLKIIKWDKDNLYIYPTFWLILTVVFFVLYVLVMGGEK